MKTTLTLAAAVLAVLLAEVAIAKDVAVIVDGSVVEETTGQPIEGASVSPGADVSPVLTDKNGRFKVVVLTSQPVPVKIHKEGYLPFERIVAAQPMISLSVKLARIDARLRVVFSSFRRGSEIRGRVEGLAPAETSRHRIVVYVLTDKWYIHPYAENRAGRGFASIAPDGVWRIETVWRGFQAYRVAYLLVRADLLPRSTVRVESADPNESLLAGVPTVASLILDAPAGI